METKSDALDRIKIAIVDYSRVDDMRYCDAVSEVCALLHQGTVDSLRKKIERLLEDTALLEGQLTSNRRQAKDE